MRSARHNGVGGDTRNACEVLVGKFEAIRPCTRPRCGWVDDINVSLKDVRCESVAWVHLNQ
jgi:hypothetical protein